MPARRTIHGRSYVLGPNADFHGADLHGANLSGLDLNNSNFEGANLEGANLSGGYLFGSNFSRANLNRANLTRSDCNHCNFRRANLTDVSLVRCSLNTADFSRAIMTRADLTSAYTRGAIYAGSTREAALIPCEYCAIIECECQFCEACEERCNGSRCEDCHNCRTCCTCEPEASNTFERNTNPIKVHHTTKIGECKRLAGVEYETTDRPSERGFQWSRKWGAGWHEDGSCGYEAVTPPCAGSNIDACLTDLQAVIGHTDSRCGIHVHVDAKDLTWADMYRFLTVWEKIEPIMFLLGGQKRLRNSYCEPCGSAYAKALTTPDPKEAILAIAYAVPVGGAKAQHRVNAHKKLHGRYKSVNIAPWVYGRRKKNKRPDTTLEFRLHRNGDSAERVIGWTHLCVAVVDWCSRASDAEVKKLPKSNLRALCEVIAPKSKAWILNRVSEWRKVTRVGMQGSVRRIDARTWQIKQNPRLRTSRTQSDIEREVLRRITEEQEARRIRNRNRPTLGNCDCNTCRASRGQATPEEIAQLARAEAQQAMLAEVSSDPEEEVA